MGDKVEGSNTTLSDVTVFNKYAKFKPEEQRRENWQELVQRNKDMHLAKYPHMLSFIDYAYEHVFDKKILPSMRSLQFGGKPIEVANNRVYNCAYAPVDDIAIFSEMMFLLLGGTGGGYSVQTHHVDKLPTVLGTDIESRRFLVGDSIEGWADAIKVLMESHFYGKSRVRFDLSDIREKGEALITTGGKAPGPEPLRKCLGEVERVLDAAKGRKLLTVEAHDIICLIADSVLAGGIRRAALMCLFSKDDDLMLTSKLGNWWEDNPQRGRANNSAVLLRGHTTEAEFKALIEVVEASKCGEPGIYWTNDLDWGTNPCCEISLRPFQFCNLCEINVDNVVDQDDLNGRAVAAAIIGTLQAGYTDFHYLRQVWKTTTEEEALIGVGMTGIGSGRVLGLSLWEAAEVVKSINVYVAKLIGINAAARTTTVKPSGTSALVLGGASGIHAWYGEYYIRRMRAGYNEAITQYLLEVAPELVEADVMKADGVVLSFPQKAPENSILRNEPLQDLLERVRKFNLEWVHTGHRYGSNTHNVSCTLSIKPNEWGYLADWMWQNQKTYNGMAMLPYDDSTYEQMPFEEITKEEFDKLSVHMNKVTVSDIKELVDNTNLMGESACAGGLCEVV